MRSEDSSAGAATVQNAERIRTLALKAARFLWVAITVITLSLYLDGLPLRYEQLIFVTDARSLLQLNFSEASYGTFLIGLDVIVVFAHVIIATIIFRRRIDDWMALFLAYALVTNGALLPLSLIYTGGALNPLIQLALQIVTTIGLIAGMNLLYLFPTGRFIPRWTGWMALSWAFLMVTAIFLPTNRFSFPSWPTLIQILILIVWIGVGIYAQIYRYRNVSRPTQQQQAKWAMFGLFAAAAGPLVYFLPFVILPALSGPVIPNILYQRVGASFFAFSLFFRLAGSTIFTLVQLVFPLSFAIAILRYRLWDIDVIINRALVYGVLTGLLLVIFFGGVTLLENVFRTFTGQGNQLAVVISTLSIAGLFNPLRLRVQDAIDRRFYRQKYDAAQALASFANTVRDEVDLARMENALIAAVDETMQPEHVSLWLKAGFVPKSNPHGTRDVPDNDL
jgi:hypothetical protein